MQYRKDKYGNDLSVLGFGFMRVPVSMAKCETLVQKAIASGINYFDTAYFYPGNEEKLGTILKKFNLRDKIKIATKLPLPFIKKTEDIEEKFQTTLKRLQTEHVEYYLMHNMPTLSEWERMKSLGIVEWIEKKKKSGEIKQIGFSFHGTKQCFLDILNDYDWDFCQIQYNYSDEHNQAGVTGLKAAAAKGVPVIVMEPLLGGKLANSLPEKAKEVFKKYNPSLSPADWAFNWLYDQPEVTCILSGMNDEAQLEENLTSAEKSKVGMLSESDLKAFEEVKAIFKEFNKVPCTGCGYCMPCPHGVNIPGCFNCYNMSYTMNRVTGIIQYATATGVTGAEPRFASKCVECGACEEHCPQSIKIREELKNVEKRLEPLWFKAVLKIARAFMAKKK